MKRNIERAEIVRNELSKMKTFDTDEKCCIISNCCYHYLSNVKGYDTNDELMKQFVVLQACIQTEEPVAKQLVQLNELKEHLKDNQYEFLDEDTVKMLLNEIDKYVIDFPEEALQFFK